VGEGIFLANIVPRPKIAMFKFFGDGTLKPYLRGYFRFLGNIMARRGLTPSDTSSYGFYNVRLREGLRQYLSPDTTEVDTTDFPGEDDDALPVINTQDESKNLFDRLFGRGKKDTTTVKSSQRDTTKTKKQLREERRAQRRLEKELEKAREDD